MASSRNTYWCHICVRGIRLRSRLASTCPHCNTGFIQELNETHMNNNHDLFEFNNNYSNNHDRNIMDNVAALISQRMLENVRSNGPRLIFHGQIPNREGLLNRLFGRGQAIEIHRANASDYFVGPGLDDFIEQMANEHGRPPASRSLIESMPTVKISEKHIRSGDSHCPVCQEGFELGCRVRKMPCKHLYHSECILPWLEQHNSCPVCRYEMGAGGKKKGRNPFSFLWPFRSSNPSRR